MRVPQVNERVKEAPAQALRAIFAGIGQLLSVSDKIRSKPDTAQAPANVKTATPETAAPKTMAPETMAPETVTPETMAPETMAPETAAPETVTPETVTPETVAPKTMAPETKKPRASRKAPAAKTMAPETMAPETKKAPATRKAPAAKKTPATAAKKSATAGGHVRLLPPDETPAAPAATAAPEATSGAAAAADLPVPNYDDLSIASLRARLRNLTTDQVSQLLAYEQGHAARADVISMYERRIEKLAEG